MSFPVPENKINHMLKMNDGTRCHVKLSCVFKFWKFGAEHLKKKPCVRLRLNPEVGTTDNVVPFCFRAAFDGGSWI